MGILRLLGVFNKAYPTDTNESRQKWSVILVSLFVFLFLFIFEPFGLHTFTTSNRLIICLGYGSCTAMAMSLNFLAFNWITNRYPLEETWTVGTHILWNCWILLTIAFINLLYSNLTDISNFTAQNLFISLGQVFLIGLFPIGGIILLDYTHLYRKNMHRAKELRKKLKQETSHSSEFIILRSSNSDDRLQLNPNELLYLTSADNYVKIIYRVNSTIKQKLLRGTLKYFENHIDHPKIIRCHRSYIINLMQITDISGDARGYSLSLRSTDTTIPVSKTYVDHFNQQLSID
ncbi:LytTR family DNA-binding domain-containing protein [Fodinibius sp. Rm-B-1B1-1]|uniref:LytR/AlgR family response regulator transcription factor n=1 Tax=Fodinibius alkaliphilus TaxID=3140241 RepID=UPI00315A2834